MATHGNIGQFDRGTEDWKAYCERLEQYFLANDVDDAAKQRAILLSVCGAAAYQLIRNLVAPAKPTDKSFADIVKLVQDHYTPPPSVTVQRFKFHSRSQKEGESIAEFVAELRRLSEHCQFEATLDDMLRDRLVCGVRDVRIQRRLLAEADLSFKKSFELSQAAEVAEQSAKDLQKPQTVHTVPSKPFARNCYRCGGTHASDTCRFRDSECHFCHKKGHLAKVCRSKTKQQSTPDQRPRRRGRADRKSTQRTLQVDEEGGAASTYDMFAVRESSKTEPIRVTVLVNSASLEMEVDTGASCSIISATTYDQLWPKDQSPPLSPTQKKLCTYTRESLQVKGAIAVTVHYQGQTAELELVVVAGAGPSLLGRDWLQKIRLDWQRLHQIRSANVKTLQPLLKQHADVFRDELGLVEAAPAKIHVDPSAQPRFCKPRTVPYALKGKIEQELERLEHAGVIEPVQFADWAAPIVPVVKTDGTIRICGDYKVTINRAAKVDTYPLPRIDDLLASLGQGKSFTKLDLAHAYQQIPLDEGSKKYVVINTHKGLYQYNRLPFGVASAPSIFQRTMEGILQGIPNVCVYIDDILVTGPSEQEHLKTLDNVFTRLAAAGLRLKKAKCSFMQPSVEYLGHNISADGLRTTQEKVRAIADAPAPRNVTQLRSFLGLVNYYGKFLSNLSSTLAPLHRLLQKKTPWTWGPEQQKAFQEAKSQLTSPCLLVHFDPDRELLLACDASPYGVGAVLSHRMVDGSEKPIAFASRSLAPAEKGYAQLDKEGLAIVFGVRKFHHFLFGRHFEILSDHKPLQHLFSESRPVPAMASARLQRWALTLSAYNYTITYKPGESHANADVLSRLPLPEAPSDIPLPGETILLLDTLHEPVSATKIKHWTDRDPLLSSVRRMVQKGWQYTSEEKMRPFNQRKDELSVQDGCILWGSRVVVPQAGRATVLAEIHQGHPGVSRMKGLARGVVWWPGIDVDIEGMVKDCHQCQTNRKAPASAPLHPWEWPARPWARIHIDHAGPFQGKLFLVVVDAHSKWLEVVPVSSTSSRITIDALRSIFATHGLPEMLVSDNGTAYTSVEFQTFMKRNGVRHVTSAPYHPSSNGLAERAVQTFKEGLKKTSATESDLPTRLARFLFQYRITPHSTTGVSPAELLMGRRPRSHLDLLHPMVESRVLSSQARQKAGHDQHARDRAFVVGDEVYVRNFAGGSRWLPGVVTAIKGPLSYEVKLLDDRVVRRHIDHVRQRFDSSTIEQTDDWLPTPATQPETPPETPPVEVPTRRSSRVRVAPDRYDPSLN